MGGWRGGFERKRGGDVMLVLVVVVVVVVLVLVEMM
jgi:hypothetical protein